MEWGGVIWAMRRQSFLKGKVERCQKYTCQFTTLALCFYQKLLIPRTELVDLVYLLDLLQYFTEIPQKTLGLTQEPWQFFFFFCLELRAENTAC